MADRDTRVTWHRTCQVIPPGQRTVPYPQRIISSWSDSHAQPDGHHLHYSRRHLRLLVGLSTSPPSRRRPAQPHRTAPLSCDMFPLTDDNTSAAHRQHGMYGVENPDIPLPRLPGPGQHADDEAYTSS